MDIDATGWVAGEAGNAPLNESLQQTGARNAGSGC